MVKKLLRKILLLAAECWLLQLLSVTNYMQWRAREAIGCEAMTYTYGQSTTLDREFTK